MMDFTFNKKIFFVLVSVFTTLIVSAQNFYNSGASVNISSGVIVSGGSFSNTSGAINNDGSLVLGGTLNNASTIAGNGAYDLAADFSNSGTFTPNSSTVTLNGTSAQNINGTSPTTFNNLTVNNTAGVTLGNNATVNGTLALAAGNFSIASYNLTLGAAAVSVSSPSASKMIIASGSGEVRRSYTSTGSYTFPIGDDTGTLEYSPITVDVTAGSGFSSAYVGVSTEDSKYTSNNSPTNYLTRSWKVNQSGITGCTATVNGTYINTAADVTGTLGSIKAAQLNGTFNQATNPWVKTGGSVLSGTTLTYTGATITSGQSSIFTGITSADPTITITNGASETTCYGADIALTTTFTGDPSVTYSWSPTTFLSSSTIANPVITDPTSSVTYTVTLKDANGIAATNNYALTTNGTLKTYNGSWSPSAPTSNDGALITSSLTTAGSGAGDITACTLTVNNSANVVIASGDNVSLNEAIKVTSPATFTLNNNANLIQTTNATNSGNIIVKRNSSPIMRFDYTLWSSPVTGQELYAFSPYTFANRFYRYITSTNFYNTSLGFNITGLNPDGVNGIDQAHVLFATGKGYLIRTPWNHPTAPAIWNGQFTGVPNNGDITFTMDYAGAPGFQFNLTGNPYPSPIDAELFVANANNFANITGTLYFWRKTNNSANPSYSDWTSGMGYNNPNGEAPTFDGIIQTGQGFFVEATGTGAALNYTNTMRIGDNVDQFFRSANTVERHRIWLKAYNAAGIVSQTLFGYVTDATLAVDKNIDGKYINDGEIAITTIINDVSYSIQGRPLPFDTADIVPLYFKVTNAGNYTIAIDHVDGLFTGGSQIVYLRDNLTGTIHNLNTGVYNFTSAAGTFATRFEILYQMPLHVDNPTFNANQVVVYQNAANDVVINSGNAIMATVKIFDIRGRLLVQKKGINTSQAIMSVGSASEVLLVQITSIEGERVTKKVVR